MAANSCVMLLVFLLCFVSAPFSLCGNLSSSTDCIERERRALLNFKESFGQSLLPLVQSSLLLSSWKGKNCCQWKGVGCDNVSGHVVKLDLHSVDSFNGLQAWDVNSSLLELDHLNYLDLSGNFFSLSRIPTFFGSMKQLEYLNLSNSYFSGKIPHHLGNLSNLRILDVSGADEVFLFQEALYVDDINWVSQLRSLQHLEMNGVNLTGAHNLFGVLNMLPSLAQVKLSGCGLTTMHISQASVNSSFLATVQALDLSKNPLCGPIPDVFQNMSSIRVLELFDSRLSSIPSWLGNLNTLVHLNLSNNQFTRIGSPLASVLANTCSLKSLDLSNSMHVPEGIVLGDRGNLSGCMRYDLEKLWLRGNGIKEYFPSWIGEMKNLKYLDLGQNSIYGPIPSNLGGLLDLEELDLSNNQLKGIIPFSLGRLVNLHTLDLSNNSLNGSISNIHLANLTYLKSLRIAHNNLAVKIQLNWTPPFQLQDLQMASCQIGAQVPQWLQTQKDLVTLDLSNTSMWGAMPSWLQDMQRVKVLDLSNNRISGSIPENFGKVKPNLWKLLLKTNLIDGSIPDSLCKIEYLSILDLSENRLTSEIPDCWGKNQGFSIINLSSNKLSGTIPFSFGNLFTLNWLNLSNNSLHGPLPSYIKDFTLLEILDLGENHLSGKIPSWLGESLPTIQVLRLRQNSFTGNIPSSICQLRQMQILDLAKNSLSGPIPHCIGHLRGMILKGSSEVKIVAPAPIVFGPSMPPALPPDPISAPAPFGPSPPPLPPDPHQWQEEGVHQVLKGIGQQYTKTLKYLVNIDLSENNLEGMIPTEITSLSRLIGLNLAKNKFSGEIPKNIGEMKSLESIDFSYNKLSGNIPPSMVSLTWLSHLNLSYNNLSGAIPTSNQFQSLNDPFNYVGNSYLCGDPLPNKCPGDHETAQAPTSTHGNENEDEKEKWLFYFVIALGYITGFWGVIGALILKKNWRHSCFRYVEKLADKIYVAVAVRVSKLKRRMQRNPADE